MAKFHKYEKYDMRVDGDTILCRAGFSADSRSKELSHSLYNTKLIMEMLKTKFPGTCKVYLSGGKDCNFRYNLTDTYKSNRKLRCKRPGCENSELKPMEEIQQSNSRYFRAFQCECGEIIQDGKPIFIDEIRQYLLAKYDTEVCKWGEADDWLGVNPNPNTVIVSNDKDLLMLPAYHYRLSSEKLIKARDPGMLWISDDNKKILGTGFLWFCAQMLLGDAVDGIKKPVKGNGPVAVYKLLYGLKSIREAWNRVESMYEDKDFMLLNAQLLWIARKPKQMMTLELLDELIEEIDNDEVQR